jgi:hypothetical protein
MQGLEENTARLGRRPTKFTPANIQKIKELVNQGVSREQVAQLLDVSLGSLQVTCSRLGISLRRRGVGNTVGERRIRVTSRQFVSNGVHHNGHMQDQSTPQAKFQFVMERQGEQRTTDLPIGTNDIQRLALQASLQNVGITELMGQVLVRAIKNNMIQNILDRSPIALIDSAVSSTDDPLMQTTAPSASREVGAT